MFKYNYLFGLIIVFVGCNTFETRGNSESMEKTTDFIAKASVEGNNLKIKYSISHKSSKDIWVCQDVEAYDLYDLPVTLDITKDTLIVGLKRWKVPDGYYFEEWPVTKYKRLKSGKVIDGEIIIQLPVSDSSPISNREKVISQEQGVLKKVVFELGFYLEDLSKIKSNYGKFDPNTDTVYVDYFWKKVNKEQVITTTIEDISIPAIIKEYKR